MKTNKTQYRRLIELDRRIRSSQYPNCISFAAEWEVSRKTIQRDIDFLRDQCGAPIEYSRARRGFYYENPAWVLPSVVMTEGELMALLMGARAMEQYAGTPIAAELRRVFNKLSDMLPESISLQPEALFSDFTFRGPPAKPIDPQVWATVVRGLLNHRTVRVRYRPSYVDKESPGKWSRINPYHLVNLQGEWYVFGVHAGYDDVRQFAVPRMLEAEPTDDTFEVPEDFNPDELLTPVFGRYAGDGKVHNVRLLFDKRVADWITERPWHPEQKLRKRRNGDIELRFPAKGLYEVQRWVLSWGAAVQVLGPVMLRNTVAEEIQAMAHSLEQAGKAKQQEE